MFRFLIFMASAVLVLGTLGHGSATASPGGKPQKNKKPQPQKGGDAEILRSIDDYVACAASKDRGCMDLAVGRIKKGKGGCNLVAGRFGEADETTKVLILQAAVESGCVEVALEAAKLLESPDCTVKGELMGEMARLPDKALFEPISKTVRFGQPFEREKGCEALGKMGFSEAIPVLIEATGAQMFSVRLKAAEALGSFKGAEVREALCKMLTSDSNSGVRVRAAQSLALVKELESVPCLAAALKDTNGNVQVAAHEALMAVTGMDVGSKDEPWLQWYQKNKPAPKGRRN